MNLKRIMAAAAVCGVVAIGLGTVLPAGAQTGRDTSEPAPETTQCQYGQWPGEVHGRPVQLQPGAEAGLYLWHDDHGWHAFVTHADHTPVLFRITVRSTSKIYGVETHDEHGDAVIEHADDHAVTLRARNFGYLDGMNFRTACGPGIEVSGRINGTPLQASQVFIGHDGEHPATFPVKIKRS